MKLIPLYDATAPITCTIKPDEIAARIEVIERMRTNLSRLDHTDHGLVLRFSNRANIVEDVHRFAIDEKRCCQFWGFAIDSTDNEMTLRWDAPPAASELLATIAAYLQGNQPVTAISELL
jgi:hypothetical protein